MLLTFCEVQSDDYAQLKTEHFLAHFDVNSIKKTKGNYYGIKKNFRSLELAINVHGS